MLSGWDNQANPNTIGQQIQIKKQFMRVEKIRTQPMSVDRYLKRWVPQFYGITPRHPRWKQACIQELCRVFPFVTPTNIRKNWKPDDNYADAPTYAPYHLRMADLANQILMQFPLPESIPKE